MPRGLWRFRPAWHRLSRFGDARVLQWENLERPPGDRVSSGTPPLPENLDVTRDRPSRAHTKDRNCLAAEGPEHRLRTAMLPPWRRGPCRDEPLAAESRHASPESSTYSTWYSRDCRWRGGLRWLPRELAHPLGQVRWTRGSG